MATTNSAAAAALVDEAKSVSLPFSTSVCTDGYLWIYALFGILAVW